MFAGNYPVFAIDLNMLRGDRINTRMKYAEYGSERYGKERDAISEGAVVLGIDEEKTMYPGVIEAIEGQRVKLRLDLSSAMPEWIRHVDFSYPVKEVELGPETTQAPVNS